MELTLLWTDSMVWLLVFALLGWGWILSRSVQVKRQWHKIFNSSIAMASAIVLLFYLFFALLDSIHFKVAKQGNMVSLLDMAFEHRIKDSERTYSAPFALKEYAKSVVVRDGITQQVNLPLKYVNRFPS